jgi:hypothetical protein
MTETSFDRVISEHLALCERNKRLERRMPLDRYRDPGAPATERPAAAPDSREHWLDHESFWDTSGERPLPEFDWGD